MVASNMRMWLFSRHLGSKGVIHCAKSSILADLVSIEAERDYIADNNHEHLQL